MILKKDAERRIIEEFLEWKSREIPGQRASGTHALGFFVELQKEKPELFRFRHRGDKWQVVHAWLLRAGLVSD